MKFWEPGFRQRAKYFFLWWLFPFALAVSERLNNDALVTIGFLVGFAPVALGWIMHKLPVREMTVFWWLAPLWIWYPAMLLLGIV